MVLFQSRSPYTQGNPPGGHVPFLFLFLNHGFFLKEAEHLRPVVSWGVRMTY